MNELSVLPELWPLDPFRNPRLVGSRLPEEALEEVRKHLDDERELLLALIHLLEGLLAEAEAERRSGRWQAAIALYNRLLEEADKARQAAGLDERVERGLAALADSERLAAYVAAVEPKAWRERLGQSPRLFRRGLLDAFEPIFRPDGLPQGAGAPQLPDLPPIPDVPSGQPLDLEELLDRLQEVRLPIFPPAPIADADSGDLHQAARQRLLSLLVRIPVASAVGLAECHLGLGRFAEAQELLDLAVRPEAWEKAEFLAGFRHEILGLYVRLHLAWAVAFLERGDVANAQAELTSVIEIDEDARVRLPADAWPRRQPVLEGAVRHLGTGGDEEPVPEPVLTAVNRWLENPDDELSLVDEDGNPSFRLPTPAVRAVIEIVGRLFEIMSGQLGEQDGFAVAPVWRFEYLFQLAGYFVTQARSAELRGIEFLRRAESAELNRQQLQDAVLLARTDEELAETRVAEARASLTVAKSNEALARRRRTNAQERLAGYSAIAHDLAIYQALSASLGAGSDGVWTNIQPHVDRMRREGRTRGRRGHLIGANTYIVATLSSSFELRGHRGQIRESQAAERVAAAQRRLVEVQGRAAQGARVAARLRRESAERYLETFDQGTFSPELLREMSRLMREISESYFRSAFEIALAMQQAFNYEHRTQLRIIDPGRRPRGVAGFLAADQLGHQVDGFKAREVEVGDRRLSTVRWTVPLQKYFPGAWQAFLAGGTLEWSLTPEMLDRAFPGLFDVSLLEVRLTFGGVSESYLRWSLTNSHLGQVRMLLDAPDHGLVAAPEDAGDGVSKIGRRYQSVETLVGPTLGGDVAGLRYDGGRESRKRLLFESSSPFCSWQLRVHPEITGANLSMVGSCSLEMVLRGEYDQALAERRIAALRELESQQQPERFLSLRLSEIAPEALESLRQTGEAELELRPQMTLGGDDGVVIQLIEDYEVQLELRSLAVVVALNDRPEAASAGIRFDLGVPTLPDGTPATATVETGADGGVRSQASQTLAALVGPDKLPVGNFKIRFQTDGGRLSNGLASVADLRDVGLMLGYRYERGVRA